MSVSVRVRVWAVLSAVILALGFAAGRPRAVHAALAYSPGFIAYGSGYSPSWTVVDVGTRVEHQVTPSGGGYDAASSYIHTLRYSPDARHVAFVAASRSEYNSESLWVASADGTGAHRIADGGADRIAWTPDGSRILFGQHGILSVPMDGSGPPIQAVPDPCGSSPQTTTRGYIFYTRQCSPGSQAGLAVFRPGDTTPSLVSSSQGSVSPDGSHIARVSTTADYQSSPVTVGAVGANSPGRQVDVLRWAVNPVVEFGPSGDIAYAYQICCNGPYRYTIGILSDSPSGRIDYLSGGDALGFLDWVNGPSNLPGRPTADRVGGADRVDTALAAADWAFDAWRSPGRHATTAVLTRDDLYPDALTGTALAIQTGGPLLLTPSSVLDNGAATELSRILAPGSTVYLLGGPAALSPGIADSVKRLGFTPVRLGGADRYATAAAIANAISGTHPRSVLLATGTNFPDALTAGVAAGQERYSLRGTDAPGGGVVLLTNGPSMPAATLAYLKSVQPDTATLYAVGGPAATAMRSVTPRWSARVSLVGADRFDTAARLATSALFGNGTSRRYTLAAITTGLNFPDAMSGGALAGSQDAPLLLSGATGLTPAENAILGGGHLAGIVVVGGPAAVSNGTLSAAADTAFGQGAWDSFTNRFAPPLR